VLSAEGLDFRSPWRPRCFVGWRDINDVSYSILARWFVIRSAWGQTIRVPTWIAGISSFVGELRKRLDPLVFDDARSGFELVERDLLG
jgi:hypothetical protein